MFCGDKVANENAKLLSIFFYQYLVMEMPKIMMRKECKEDKQTLAEYKFNLSPAVCKQNLS